MEVAPQAVRTREEEGEQDIMSTQQLQGLLGKHGYSFHLVEPFSGSGESEDEGELVVCVSGACLQRIWRRVMDDYLRMPVLGLSCGSSYVRSIAV